MGGYDDVLDALPATGPATGSLHCPARLLLVAPTGAAAPVVLAPHLAAERVARVWTAPHDASVRAAGTLAAALDVDVVVRDGLGGDAAAVREVLEEVADTHRGETVLVVTGPEDLGARATGIVAVEVGDDGWRRLPDPAGPPG